MNSENQKIIITIFGASLLICIIGVVLATLFHTGIESITLLLGVVTTIIGILATFLQDKKLSEKESETLEKYFLKQQLQDNDVTVGSISFDSEDEMKEYLENKTVEQMIEDADTVTVSGENVQ